jgi:transcriptional regulator with XRE-family HTH domain
MEQNRTSRTRWPTGTWMRLISTDTLRALMAQKGVSLQDLADAARVSKGFISHLTAGRKKTMTPRVADAIARRLDVPLTVLFMPSVSPPSSGTVNHAGKKVAA